MAILRLADPDRFILTKGLKYWVEMTIRNYDRLLTHTRKETDMSHTVTLTLTDNELYALKNIISLGLALSHCGSKEYAVCGVLRDSIGNNSIKEYSKAVVKGKAEYVIGYSQPKKTDIRDVPSPIDYDRAAGIVDSLNKDTRDTRSYRLRPAPYELALIDAYDKDNHWLGSI